MVLKNKLKHVVMRTLKKFERLEIVEKIALWDSPVVAEPMELNY